MGEQSQRPIFPGNSQRTRSSQLPQQSTDLNRQSVDLNRLRVVKKTNHWLQTLIPSRELAPTFKENLIIEPSADIILNVVSLIRGMAYNSADQRISILSRHDRLLFKLVFQSKFRLLVISTLIGLPIIGSSSAAYWLYQQNQALENSAREVVGEVEALNQKIENLNQRAGLPKTTSVEVAFPNLKGRGGVPVELAPEDQLEMAKAKLPMLSRQFESETKPALEKKLKHEAVLSQAKPTGNPVKGSFFVSSDFGVRPNPFYGGGYEGHDGIDILGEYGTPIYATASGKAERAGYVGGYGNHVLIKNSQGYETLYAHLSKLAVKPKAQIKQGQLIGYMGSTGRSTGVHLHYSVYFNGKPMDPKPFMEPNLKYYAEVVK